MTALILLTIRELRAKLIIVGLFAVATFVWLMLTFALNLDIVDGTLAGMRIFGQETALEQQVEVRDEETGEVRTETLRPFGENPLENLVISVQQGVAGITFWVVLLLGLFATGSLVASMMERGQVDLLLSKPVARSTLLGGRLLGVGAVVAALVVYVLGAVWLVISIKSGIWNGAFLVGVAVVLTMFAVLYGIVTLVSVWTESTALAMIVALGVIVASIVLAAGPEAAVQINRPWREVYVGLYYVLPNFPAATSMTWTLAGGEAVEDWVPFFTSLAFGAACYAGAFALFQRKDF
jgi:ABC-type transport system involved in multi-copper enzyme maturation permease subunit